MWVKLSNRCQMVLEFQIKPLQFLFSPYRIQKAETILFSSNCGFRKSGRFFVTRLDYWIVQMCFLCWKRCGPEITDRKQNTSSVYLPMWQGNSIFFFFFQSCAPRATLWIFDICLTLRHFEELWHPCREYAAKSASWTVEKNGFTFDLIKSHRNIQPRVSLKLWLWWILRETSILECRCSVYRQLYLTFPVIYFFLMGWVIIRDWLLIITIIQYFLIMLLLHKFLFNDSDQAVIKVAKLVTLFFILMI